MRGAALQHKKQFERMMKDAVQIELRMPAAVVPAAQAVDKVMGKRPTPTASATTAYGPSKFVSALWGVGYSITTAYGAVPPHLAALGQSDNLDVVLRCPLADVLLDQDKPLGRTVFHTAKDVVYQGEVFTVTGVDASGLPPLGPYICWVGLKKAGVSA